MEHLDDDKLQRLFDDDLTEGEAILVRRDVESSDLEKARLAQLERLGDLVRLAADDMSADLDADALFAKIDEGIKASPNPRLRVIEGEKQRQKAGVAVAIAVAIAAAVTLVLLLKPAEENVAGRHPMDTRREAVAQQVQIEDPELHIVHPPGGSQVLDVDFGSNTGTHFSVMGDHGEPLAVVWIDEEAP